jgi:hypothetical protein
MRTHETCLFCWRRFFADRVLNDRVLPIAVQRHKIRREAGTWFPDEGSVPAWVGVKKVEMELKKHDVSIS